MNAKHTPGPWETDRNNGFEYDIEGNGLLIAQVREGNAADANLISAAPDLLAALQEMLPRFQNLRELAGFSIESDAAERASAAIAKATGGQS